MSKRQPSIQGTHEHVAVCLSTGLGQLGPAVYVRGIISSQSQLNLISTSNTANLLCCRCQDVDASTRLMLCRH